MFFCFQAEDGIRGLVRSRGLGDGYKSQPLEPCLETVDVNELIRHTVELQTPQLEMDGIQVTTDLAADLPPTQADPWKLQQVFVNLICNARQAILAQQAGGRLYIAARAYSANGDGACRIQVLSLIHI